jgi:hypothetical protein
MSRHLLPILLILTLVLSQGLALHGHMATAGIAVSGHADDHDAWTAHSHVTDQTAVEHADAVELDIIGAASAPQDSSLALFAVLVGWVLILQVLWVCITRWPVPPPLIHFGPPRFLHPTLRAPPH